MQFKHKLNKKISTLILLVFFFEVAFLPAVESQQTNPGSQNTASQLLNQSNSQADPQNIPNASIVASQSVEISFDKILSPIDQVNHLFKLMGDSPQMVEAKSYAEWMLMISSIYTEMGPEAKDVMTFYSAVSSINTAVTSLPGAGGAIPYIFQVLSQASNFAAFLFSQVQNLRVGIWLQNVMEGYATSALGAFNYLSSLKHFSFLQFMNPPIFWEAANSTDQGMNAYWYWVTKNQTSEVAALETYQGVARSIGIGFLVLSCLLDTTNTLTSRDTVGGRYFSFQNVKSGVFALTELGMLVCMFVPPPFGQICGLLCLGWSVATLLAEVAVHQFQRQETAYKNSFWFLYENDPQFKLFYDNRATLTEEEKTSSIKITEKHYSIPLSQQQPKTEHEKRLYEKGKNVLEAIEKQEYLSTYYCRTGFSFPDFDLSFLEELWNHKASYMAWKPTEQEAKDAQQRSFFGNVGNVLNPLTWLKGALNSINQSSFLNDKNINADLKLVFFNPDYVLLKKYEGFLMGKNIHDSLHDLVHIRLEDEPFNYIYLLGISTSEWDDPFLAETFNADSFIIFSKEALFVANVLKRLNDQGQQLLKDNKLKISNISDYHLPRITTQIELLEKLLESYQNSSDQLLSDELQGDLLRNLSTGGRMVTRSFSAKDFISQYRGQLEKEMFMLPVTLGTHANDLIALDIALKKNFDISALFEKFVSEKDTAVQNFEKQFKNQTIKNFLAKGDFLDKDGKSFMRWVAGEYSPYDEATKQLNLIKKELEDYKSLAQTSNSSRRNLFLGFGYDLKGPDELLQEINRLVERMSVVYRGFYQIKDETNMNFYFSPNEKEEFEKYFPEDGFKLMFGQDGRKALDLNKKLDLPAASLTNTASSTAVK
ncbi:MAG: hypothetical protein HQM08_09490 [Candidatus Riflebacteria bacterium]|nr:hypothetical protein [Candidatus Riflebacteria bacterium]